MYLGAKIQISEEKNKKNMSFFECRCTTFLTPCAMTP